jgi:LemA protein
LSELETELQSSRRYYNATVRDLNTRVQSFPDNVFSRHLGFTEEPFYQDADETIQTAPKVSFPRSAA